MARFILLMSLMAALAQAGCSSGYTKIDGKWCYVVRNAAVGREVREIDADADSFEVLSDRTYARDNYRVYRYGRALEGMDGRTYRLLDDTRYAVDRNGVYYKDYKVPDADPETFRVIGHPYGRDASAVFYGTLKMDVAEPSQFKVTSVEGSMQVTCYFYSSEELVEQFGEGFRDVPVDDDHPVVVPEGGTGTDGVWTYRGPRRLARVQ